MLRRPRRARLPLVTRFLPTPHESPILLDDAEPSTGAAAVFGQREIGRDQLTLDCPPEEPVGDQPGGGAGGDPAVEVPLLKVAELDAFGGELGHEVDRDRDGLLAAQEGYVGHVLGLVHPP
jgi:hypothetical protein